VQKQHQDEEAAVGDEREDSRDDLNNESDAIRRLRIAKVIAISNKDSMTQKIMYSINNSVQQLDKQQDVVIHLDMPDKVEHLVKTRVYDDDLAEEEAMMDID
jgi:hypothetical protein